ncbi:hypothetical protein SBY92_003915 [Candida maltosa Xu316]|uniref:Uncharacterized protein n=1 Tax=Candida maltosa (strain Xu316) TaxID=1245528 RepID=M3HMG3_CANMX|nr:hypothetical protein G210_0786 [Candida maltosa Xu316]
MFSRQLARTIQRNQHYRQFSLTNWFKSWKDAAQSQRLIYPPPASQFTTQNRIIDTYITEKSEVYNYLSVKPPLLLHFTYATKENNKFTQALFDVLSDKSKYPNKEPVYLVNILADSEGGRELMMDYVVGSKIPSIVVLKHQLPSGRYAPDIESFTEQDLVEWLRSI